MALDPTARLSNVMDSWKKYLVDNIYRIEKIDILFDKFSANPKVRDKSIDRWISVDFKQMELSKMSTASIDIYCATQKDGEWFRLAQLRDTVMGHLTIDPDDAPTDGIKRIPFYKSMPGGSSNWTLLSNMLITEILESDQMETGTDTKFKILTIVYKFASKV